MVLAMGFGPGRPDATAHRLSLAIWVILEPASQRIHVLSGDN
jgi:hypothetical protein